MSTMDEIRAEAKQRNDNQKKIAAERLKKNAEYNKAHKPSKSKEVSASKGNVKE